MKRDLLDRTSSSTFDGHYAKNGILKDRKTIKAQEERWIQEIYYIHLFNPPLIFFFHFFFAFLFLFGYKTWLSNFVCWILSVSLQEFNFYVKKKKNLNLDLKI
jgi:hypothetical protein